MAISTTPPSGFRDFLPDACALRSAAAETISKVYRSYGFQQIATPAVEDLAVLMGKGGGENEKLLFKIMKRGEKLEAAKAGGDLADLGLRFDLTLPLARFYSKNQGLLPNPFKAFQIGPVWRAERAQKGRYREFYQCDADIIGSESPQCEVEVISAILAAFAALGVASVHVLLNDRRLLTALLELAGIPEDKRGEACILLDKLDKLEPQALWAEMGTLVGTESAHKLKLSLDADKLHAVDLHKTAPGVYPPLEKIKDAVKRLCGDKATVAIAPSLVRGFDYYTGPVFEFRHPSFRGSIGGGGRYDRLTENFGGQRVPACGGSIGFERLMLLLEEAGKAAAVRGLRFCVTVFSEELRAESLALAARLRAAGHDVDVYPGEGKLKAQFKYADAKGALYAPVMGPHEKAAGKVKTKRLSCGDETLCDECGILALA
jgi:histidyl-tRNA synthetase